MVIQSGVNKLSTNTKNAGNLSLLGGRPCLDFVNTLDWRGIDQPVEFLNTYQDLVLWSRHAGIISSQEAKILSQQSKARLAEQTRVLKKAIKLRETIYRIFASEAVGKIAPKKDLADLNIYLSAVMRHSRIIKAAKGYSWETGGDKTKLDWILNPLVRSAADLLVSDERKRIKKCNDPACGWLFVDTSRNKSRRWCDMSDCGNRAKASRFYKKKVAKQ